MNARAKRLKLISRSCKRARNLRCSRCAQPPAALIKFAFTWLRLAIRCLTIRFTVHANHRRKRHRKTWPCAPLGLRIAIRFRNVPCALKRRRESSESDSGLLKLGQFSWQRGATVPVALFGVSPNSGSGGFVKEPGL